MVRKDESIAIIDFDCSEEINARNPKTRKTEYLPNDEFFTEKTDVFSLGCLIKEWNQRYDIRAKLMDWSQH